MKKLVTLVASVLLVASSFAQYSNRDQNDNGRDRDYGYNDNRGDRRYHPNSRERDMKIAHINRQYDRKIHSVRNKLFMSHSKKQRIIWELENDRRSAIRQVYAKYSYGRNDRNDRRRY